MLLSEMQDRRCHNRINPMQDLFGSGYHAWLKTVRRTEFGFLVAEYQKFLLYSWREPIPPQGHVFRLVGTSCNVLTLAEASRQAQVTPSCIKQAYFGGEIEGYFARRKSRRRILWLDKGSFELWCTCRRNLFSSIQTCREVEMKTGFSGVTLKEFERKGLIRAALAPAASKVRGLCFDRESVLQLIVSVAKAARPTTDLSNQRTIALGEATRLYLGRAGLAEFLRWICVGEPCSADFSNQTEQRMFDMRFPLSMILEFRVTYSNVESKLQPTPVQSR